MVGILGYLLLLLRDVYGPGSPGKVLSSLALTPDNDTRSEALELGPRITRNLPLLLPAAGITMESVVMMYAADTRRVGDRWAGSRVLDKRPDTAEHIYLFLSLTAIGAIVVLVWMPFAWIGG